MYWAEAPGPRRASLIFRVGRGDETLATSGRTHLVEHLALFALSDELRRPGGFVDHLRTVFYSSGSDSELVKFLDGLTGAISALPLHRLELETRVLQTEEASRGGSSWQRLMSLRFGAAGFGLVDYDELGLRRTAADDVAAWARSRFVAKNAALWLTGPPPDDLRLRLETGHRFPPPAPSMLPRVELPAYVPSGGGGVVISTLGTRSTALRTALSLLERRLHDGLRLERGLSYAVSGSYDPLGAEVAHVTLGADCLDEHASEVRDQLLHELERLADEGPSAKELASCVEQVFSAWDEDEFLALSELDASATNELLGAQRLTHDELRAEYEALDTHAIAAAARELLPTVLLCAPTGEAPPAGFNPYEADAEVEPRGRRFLRRGRRRMDGPRRSPFVLSDDGLGYLGEPPATTSMEIRFDEVVAVLENGPGRLTLIAVNGDWLRLDVATLVKGHELEAVIRSRVPDDLFIPFDDDVADNVIDLAREKMGFYSQAAAEIETLPQYLERGEKVLTLAEALHRRRRGLLALTDRRLLHLSKARTKSPRLVELALKDVVSVRRSRGDFLERGIVVKEATAKHKFLAIKPSERASEFLEALDSPGDRTTFAARPVDRSLRARIRAYGFGAFLVLVGMQAFFGEQGLAIPLIAGSLMLIRTHRRRRERLGA